MGFKMRGFPKIGSPAKQTEYQKGSTGTEESAEEVLAALMKNLAEAKKTGDEDMVKKIEMDIASAKKEIAAAAGGK